ncbi:hypothetical protein [Metabacillus fastidiosus]|uniref:hypothetical protein n=1 Tax=Metabacillus fastidiosus TaxID=1458 RepID=UPI002E22E39D|nr:hypothetical protein [Metabacillus fastidiosus]
MTGFIRYQFISYIRSLKIIPPLTVFITWVIILYFYENVPVLSSYAVTSITVYLVMTWVAMTVFSIEEESEKNILFVQLGSKHRYICGKWIICVIIACIMIICAIIYPIIMGNFARDVTVVDILLSVYSHFFSAIFGITVGSFFSITSFAGKKYAWLLAVLVIVISISYEGLVEKLSMLKWFLLVFPPVAQVIKHLSGNDIVHIGKDFWLLAVWIIVYTVISFIITIRLFLRKER